MSHILTFLASLVPHPLGYPHSLNDLSKQLEFLTTVHHGRRRQVLREHKLNFRENKKDIISSL